MRIVYMGTPEFAVPSLEILLIAGYEIAAVVTSADKPGGRLGIQESAVKKFALSRGLPILQPEKLRNPAFLETLQGFQADLFIVVAFRMLPEAVWNMPPMGTMNLHGSLLPRYRGAAPINWAIINGEKETGVTTFLLKHEIDTGDLLFQQSIPIGPDETAGELHDRMMHVGAQLVLQSVQALERGNARPFPQADTEVSHAPKIFHETGKLDFSKNTESVHNLVRGLSPYPGAWTMLDGKTLKVLRTRRLPAESGTQPGAFYSDGKHYLQVGTGDGRIDLLEIIPEGKKQMQVKDFLNGYKKEWYNI